MSESEHDWIMRHSLPVCARCGIVRRGDRQNKPCSGVLPSVRPRGDRRKAKNVDARGTGGDNIEVDEDRYQALIGAALQTPCLCLIKDRRLHDGRCISCWALAKRVADLQNPIRNVTRTPYDDATLARLQGEIRLRARQLAEAGTEAES